MKVLHSGSLADRSGGPAMTTYLTVLGLRTIGVDAEVIQAPLREGEKNRGDDVPVHYTQRPWEYKFAFSPSFGRCVDALGAYDIYHAHGIWQWNTYAMVDAALRAHKPYLITPHGMLYPQDIAKSSTAFKRLSLRWRLLRDLNRAACVHATCDEELRHCRALGVTSPIAVIPNPIEICPRLPKRNDGVFRVVYLGRVSRRKNIESLLYAFAELQCSEAELLIIGSGEPDYEQFLRSEALRLQLHNVRFAGFQTGRAKDELLSTCSLLVMPSEFENFGNVILEGLVRQIPCIATKGSPWQVLQTYDCGWWIDYNQTAITHAIRQAMSLPTETLNQMGLRGRQLAEEQYSMDSVARRMDELYRWILGRTEKPEFVHL